MKRIEMIDEILSQLKEYPNCDEIKKEHIDIILTELEVRGMKPPHRKHTLAEEVLYSKKKYSYTWEEANILNGSRDSEDI